MKMQGLAEEAKAEWDYKGAALISLIIFYLFFALWMFVGLFPLIEGTHSLGSVILYVILSIVVLILGITDWRLKKKEER